MASVPLATAFVRIRPDLTTFKSETEAGVATAGLGKRGETEGKSFGSKFAGAASKLMVAGLVGGAVVAGLKKVIGDARALGIASLQVAVKNAGGQWDTFEKQMHKADDRMVRFGFDSADTHGALTKLTTVTGSTHAALGALGTAADLARFKHISLADASTLLAKASVGSTRALKDVGISTSQLPKHFSTTGTAAQRLHTIVGLMGKRIGGEATAYTKTFGGRLDIVKAQLTDTSAAVGVALIPILSKLAQIVVQDVVPILKQAADWLGKFADFFSKLPGPVQKTIIAVLGAIVVINLIRKAMIAFGVASKIAAFTNPWFLLAAAIVIVAVIVITNWTKIRKFAVVVWHHIYALISGVWQWVKDHWPLLLGILTGPIGLAVLFIVRHWRQISSALGDAVHFMRMAWDGGNGRGGLVGALRNAFAWFVGKLLGFFGSILNGAATAFGWIPGLGPKLKTAAAKFDKFKTDVNNSIRGISGKTVSVQVALQQYKSHASWPKAAGGEITEGTTGTADDVHVLASRGEWVIRQRSAAKYGSRAMAAINEGRAQIRYAEGGPVGGEPRIRAITESVKDIRSSLQAWISPMVRAFAESFMAGGSAIAQYAASLATGRSHPYVWGGTSPSGWDCSGFTGYVYRHFGYNPPRTSQQQQLWATPSGNQPGALVFFYGRNGNASHVGISMGGGTYAGADDPSVGTIISSLAGNTGFGVPPGGFRMMRGAPGAGGGRGSVVELGRSLAASNYGWVRDQWTNLYNLWQRESGWDPNARNPSSGAAGIPQDITGNFHGGAFGQIMWGLNYIFHRYGTPWWAWLHEKNFGWYGSGGMINEPIFGVGMRSGRGYGFGESGPEWVTNAGDMRSLISAVRSMHDAVVRALDRNAAATAAGISDALNGASSSAAYRAAYSVR